MHLNNKIINWSGIIKRVLLTSLVLLLFSFPVYGDSGLEITSIEGGFDGVHKVSGWVPFVITVNNFGEDFTGDIQVIADSFEYEFKSAYSMPFNIAKGGEKQVTIVAPVNRTRASVDVQILQDNKVIKEQKYYFKKSLNPNTLFIGALTDDASGLRYLSGADFSNQNISVQSELAALNEKTFPYSDKVLENFNVILINNFDMSTLSNEKKELLVQWVERGGLLVVGTGPNSKKVLNDLPEEIKMIDAAPAIELSSFSAFEDYGGKEIGSEGSKMPVSVLNIKKGNILLQQDDIPLITSTQFGKGYVSFFAFDAALEPFSSWDAGNQAVWKKVVYSTIASYFRGEELNSKMQYSFYHAINNALRYIPSIETPSLILLIIIIGSFIIIVGPVNYLVLKKRDKREWSWITIPAIVVVFSIGMYVVGFGTRFSTAVASIVSIIEYKDDSKSIDVSAHTGLFNPKRGTVRIKTSKDVNVDFSVNSYNSYYYVGSQEDTNKRIISKFILGDQPEVEFYDKGIWDFSSFIMNKKVAFSDSIDNSVVISNNVLKGSIKNNTGFKIEDAFIVMGNSFAKIGDIDRAETITIDQPLVNVYNGNNNYYELLNRIFDQEVYQPVMARDDEWRLNQQRRSIFEYYSMTSRLNTNTSSVPILFGWNDADLQFDVIVNDKDVKKYYQNMIVIPMDLNFVKGETVQLPYGFMKGSVEHSEGKANVNVDPYNPGVVSIEGGGKVIFKFDAPSEVKVENFTLNWYSMDMKMQGNYKLLLFNYVKDQWDEITSYYHVDNNIISEYVSPQNEIRVMFDAESDATSGVPSKGYYGWISYPDIEVEGVVR